MPHRENVESQQTQIYDQRLATLVDWFEASGGFPVGLLYNKVQRTKTAGELRELEDNELMAVADMALLGFHDVHIAAINKLKAINNHATP